MKVRVSTPEDIEAMAQVHLLSSNTAYGRDDDFARRLASTRDAVELDSVRSFVLEDDGEIIGVLGLGPSELYAIYVHPEHWGTGGGQMLIDKAHEELAKTCEVASLTCLVDNARARRFYERNGWEAGEEVTELHFGGEPTDVVYYRKRFFTNSVARRSREPS